MSDRGLPILTYHALDTSGSVIATTPHHFDRTLKALHDEGLQCVDLSGWIAAGRPPVERGFAITFDDGLTSIRLAADSLAKFEFSATAFLVTGRMGRDNQWPGQWKAIPRSALLDWPDLDDLSAAGFRFGSHTVDHLDLDRCDQCEVERQMIESKAAIEVQAGAACSLFAYPCGKASRNVQAATSRHFTAGFGTRLGLASEVENPSYLSRIDAFYLRSDRGLKRLLSGQWSPWLQAMRAARAARRAIRLA